MLFIFGLPLANNSDLDSSLSRNNSLSIFCEINYPFLNSSLFENENLNVSQSLLMLAVCMKLKMFPILTFYFLFLIIGVLLFEIISQFKIRK